MDPTQSTSINVYSSTHIRVYPNPASDRILIETSSTEIKTIIIYNTVGKAMYKNSFVKSQELEIDISGFNQGLYIVSVEIDKRFIKQKFLKK